MKAKKVFNHTNLRTIIDKARVARLATADPEECRPHLVPVVFVYDGEYYYIPLDEKTKRTKPDNLKRVKNINANPNVALLIDEYNEDWKRIWFIMVQGSASLINNKEHRQMRLIQKIHRLLYEKYPQYLDIGIGEFCIMIQPRNVISWKMENS